MGFDPSSDLLSASATRWRKRNQKPEERKAVYCSVFPPCDPQKQQRRRRSHFFYCQVLYYTYRKWFDHTQRVFHTAEPCSRPHVWLKMTPALIWFNIGHFKQWVHLADVYPKCLQMQIQMFWKGCGELPVMGAVNSCSQLLGLSPLQRSMMFIFCKLWFRLQSKTVKQSTLFFWATGHDRGVVYSGRCFFAVQL